jgi:N-acetylglucosaminyl-diphospho-decaprenol L-rhamnosyltransferase
VPLPDVSIIILSWNVRDLLQRCLSSLPLSDPDVEIIVVDAASSDSSAEMVRTEFPDVKLIASAENLGYTRGNNLALREASGRYLLILNPDTEVGGDAIPKMIEYMDAHPRVGVLGPQLLKPGHMVQSTRRRFPTLATGFFESTWLQPLAPQRLLDRYYIRELTDDTISEVDWVVGAALLVRHEAYGQVGGFDEGFFMYSEEMDWCRRMKAAGWQVIYFPPARITHHEAKSSEQVPAATHIRFNASKVRYFRKYHGARAAEALRWFLLGNFAFQLALEWAKGLLGHKREMRAERLEIYRQVLKSGLKG